MTLNRRPIAATLVTLALCATSAHAAAPDLKAFRKQALAKHNEFRAKHGAPALVADATLDKAAQAWATKLLAEGKMQHSNNPKYGENIYWFSGTSLADGGVPVQSWYNEVKKYRFDKAVFNTSTGHFTQVVWKGTKKVGCGMASNEKGTYVVCNYSPPGNVQDQFKENVLPETAK